MKKTTKSISKFNHMEVFAAITGIAIIIASCVLPN